MGAYGEDGDRFFSEMHSDRRRSNRRKMQHRKFSLDVSEKVCTVRVVKHWSTLSREVVVPEQPGLGWLCFEQGVGSDDSQGSLPTL